MTSYYVMVAKKEMLADSPKMGDYAGKRKRRDFKAMLATMKHRFDKALNYDDAIYWANKLVKLFPTDLVLVFQYTALESAGGLVHFTYMDDGKIECHDIPYTEMVYR